MKVTCQTMIKSCLCSCSSITLPKDCYNLKFTILYLSVTFKTLFYLKYKVFLMVIKIIVTRNLKTLY
jgi:hypothetical protein